MKFHIAMTVVASIVLITCSLLILFKQVDFLFEHKNIFTDINMNVYFGHYFAFFLLHALYYPLFIIGLL
jgi:hypothetical protein